MISRQTVVLPGPRLATQYALHRGQPGYDPLFAFGFGLTYRDRRELPLLPEESGVQGADAPGGTLFGGAEPSAWKMSTSGAVKLSRFDRARQEDSLRLQWSGAAGALAFDSSAGEDFSRETNADMMLVLTVKVDGAPDDSAAITVDCGAGCRASLPLRSDLAALPAGQWQRFGIPLKCFSRAGADMNRRLTRFELRAAGTLDLSVNRLALASTWTAGPAARCRSRPRSTWAARAGTRHRPPHPPAATVHHPAPAPHRGRGNPITQRSAAVAVAPTMTMRFSVALPRPLISAEPFHCGNRLPL